MKLWEVAKGMQEELYKYGDRFEVFYVNGDFYYAKVGSHDCLWWLEGDEELQLVHIASYVDSFWRLMDKDEYEIKG